MFWPRSRIFRLISIPGYCPRATTNYSPGRASIKNQKIILVAQRPAESHLAGAWEFPGGKVHRDETPLQGLVRELAEELGVTVLIARYLTDAQPEELPFPEQL